MKKFIFKMFVGSLVFFGTGFLLYFLVKARSGTTATPGDKLTASKRNEMVANMSGLQTQLNSTKRIDVSLTDTSLFDTGCERRRSVNGNVNYITAIWATRDRMFFARPVFTASWQAIKYNEKNNIYSYVSNYQTSTNAFSSSSIGTVSKLQKKCQN